MLNSSTQDFLLTLMQNNVHDQSISYKALLEKLGSPQEKVKCIHLAGTNGKGSTASFITSILICSGYKVGFYTSPDLYSVTERLRINNELISDKDFDNYIDLVKSQLEAMLHEGFCLPTYFEVLTAIAFLYFSENQCDLVVLETGLGGRSDATNVIKHPLCSVITTISYDHVPRLGTTLEEITYEKAGIIKPHSPVVTFPHIASIDQLIQNICKEKQAPLKICVPTKLVCTQDTFEGQVFNYKDYKGLAISLLGKHQLNNAVLAIEVVETIKQRGFDIKYDAIYKGLSSATWPGRFEIIQRHPLFLIDGAHNEEAAKALREALLHYFPGKKVIYLFGSLKDKDYAKVLEVTMPLATGVVLVEPPSSRAMKLSDLEALIQPYCSQIKLASSLEEGVRLSQQIASQSPDDEAVIVAFGSLYFIGQLPNLLS